MRKLVVIFLSGVICLLGTSLVLAQESGVYSTLADYEKLTGKKIEKFNEAPMLRTLVAAGELPPVEERLSEEPLVVEPIEEIGEYGGTLHEVYPGHRTFERLDFASERMLRITEGGVAPNIAKDYKFSKDGKVLTLYLRKGMKWSDGAPLTADDIMFWYKDVLLNKELNPVTPKAWAPGGRMKMKKIDDYTVEVNFTIPYPLLIKEIAHAGGVRALPKHYFTKYHIKYNPKANELAKKEGLDYWWKLFNQKVIAWEDYKTPGPTLDAFVLKARGTNYAVFERNPYYWKVDPAGNQLPYIDRIVVIDVADKEVYNGKIVAGEVDLAGMETELRNLSLYKEGAEKGNYRVLLWQRVQGVDVCYQPNQTYNKDPVLRKIFRDVRFRRALSLAINREEINETLYYGLAVPRQTTVIPQSEYYEEEFAKAYAQYDPEEANRLLDEMGLRWDENHEYRLRPDGKRLTIILEYCEMETPKTHTTELVKEYGIDLRAKVISGELDSVRYVGNMVQMGLWHADRCGFLFDLEPFWFVPMRHGWECTWAPLWAQWYVTGGEKGEEPPEEAKRNIERWKRMQTTLDKEERIRLGKEILRSQAENLWTIGTVGLAPHPVIVRNNLRNVPEKALLGWDYYWTLPQKPEQYFLKHPLLPSQER